MNEKGFELAIIADITNLTVDQVNAILDEAATEGNEDLKS